jgi:hypothetical protein
MSEISIATDGGHLFFEIDDGVDADDGFAPASPMSTASSKAARAMWKPVWAFARELVLEARESDSAPSQIEMAFSVVVKGSADFKVVKGGADGSISVKLSWKTD